MMNEADNGPDTSVAKSSESADKLNADNQYTFLL